MKRAGGKKNNLPAKIGVEAKAIVEAKVSTEIPAASSGRFVDAITDILRPFSEKRGLKADQIRLQREDVLIQIALKARERVRIENQTPCAVPNKVLIPLLEKASLEDPNGELIERWADLLASCSINPNNAHPRFVQILSEVTSPDAAVLRKIGAHCIEEVDHPGVDLECCDFNFSTERLRRRLMNWLKSHSPNVEQIYEKIPQFFEVPGVCLLDLMVQTPPEEGDEFYSMMTTETYLGDVEYGISLDVLSSLNVLRVHTVDLNYAKRELSVVYVCLTAIGVEFLLSCDRDLLARLNARG